MDFSEVDHILGYKINFNEAKRIKAIRVCSFTPVEFNQKSLKEISGQTPNI